MIFEYQIIPTNPKDIENNSRSNNNYNSNDDDENSQLTTL